MNKNKKKQISQAINFIEELSWLIETKKNLSLKEIPMLLREILESEDQNTLFNLKENEIKNKSNRRFLVGVLPDLFQDEELFKSNSELIDFAENVLNIFISKAAKRSRIEYIGWIICEVTKLNDYQLSTLVNALEVIVGNDSKLRQMKEAKKQPNFSWNETILNLSKQ